MKNILDVPLVVSQGLVIALVMLLVPDFLVL